MRKVTTLRVKNDLTHVDNLEKSLIHDKHFNSIQPAYKSQSINPGNEEAND